MGCADHVDAALAGHVRCLAQLCEKGLFLPLNSPDWQSAGEARKCQAFEAAIAGCSSGRAAVLAWIFSSGWPSNIKAIWCWHTRDLWEQHEDLKKAFPGLKIDTEPFVLEYKLYCCAVQQPTPSCLTALLDAGCRSEWICRIAAKRGCPCDLWVWEFAASTGNHAVLELLESSTAMRRLANRVSDRGQFSMERLTRIAAANGHWECLQILKRAGCKKWSRAAEGAALSGQLQIVQNLFDLDRSLLQRPDLFNAAAQGGSLACLDFLERAGCAWDRCAATCSAASSGSSEALRYCLQRSGEQLGEGDWDYAMDVAVRAGSLDCMQALYDYGYQFRGPVSYRHPAYHAIRHKRLACAHLAVQLSGPPQIGERLVRWAALGGKELLQLVHGLGGTVDSGIAQMAAFAGQAGALRYALQHGAPLSMDTFGAALKEGSVECVKCAFEHGLDVGFPADYRRLPRQFFFLLEHVKPCFSCGMSAR
eukprot:jgi/Botrbrau1/13435/Bobra.0082s0039.1